MDDGFWLRWIVRLIAFPLAAILVNPYFWKAIDKRLRRKP